MLAPLVKGARIRVGGFKGHPIDKTVYEDKGTGVLHITNQRVCFLGQPSVEGYDDCFIV